MIRLGKKGGSEEDAIQSDLNILAGVIKADDEIRMKRMVFRMSRGRAIPQFYEMGKNVETMKKIFIVFFQAAEESNFLKGKLIKICDIFQASR